VLVVDVQLADSHRTLEEVSRFSALQLVAVIVVEVVADGALQA
jgi:NCAIR mutase (PurE)-related protein